uniref:cdc42 effector protein 1-like n=1 Tax=Pristiophorus japonicus TaxID=55135 RepID=UPI00398EEDBA
MSFGKLPVFKNLVSNSHGKRRFKSELTPDMISSPLGDFRHTMHVGRGGDVFGDTSFLSDHGGEKARESAKSNLLVRALRNVRKSPMRSRNSSREMSPPPAVSPIIKNAVSLPHLLEAKNGSVERLNFKTVVSSPGVMDGSYGLESGFCTLPRWSRLDRPRDNPAALADSEKPVVERVEVTDFELPRTDSLLSFSLDLGPSLMSEVLAVMSGGGGGGSPGAGPLPGETAPNGARPVRFDLEGSFERGAGSSGGPRHNGGGGGAGAAAGAHLNLNHREGVAEASLAQARHFSGEPSCVEWKKSASASASPGGAGAGAGVRETRAERHVLRHHGGSISYPDSSVHVQRGDGECRSGSTQQPLRETTTGGLPAAAAANASLVQRILSRHFVAAASSSQQPPRQMAGTTGGEEQEDDDDDDDDNGGPRGSWRTQLLPSGQRAPADGEDEPSSGQSRQLQRDS